MEDEEKQIVLLKQTILLAEAQASNRNLYAEVLRATGYDVIEASDGLEALRMLREIALLPESHLFVGILSEILLPSMDGLQLLKKVREDKIFGEIPFMIVSELNDKHHIQMARTLGVSLYLTKPLNPFKLTEKLKLAMAKANPAKQKAKRAA